MPALLGGMARVFDRMQGKHRILVERASRRLDPRRRRRLDRQHRRAGGAHGRHPARRENAPHWRGSRLPNRCPSRRPRDALKALRDDGVAVDRIVVNRLTQPPPQRCAWCSARRRVEQRALSRLERDRRAGELLAVLPCDGRRAAWPAGARADSPAAGSDGAGAASAADHVQSAPRGGHRADPEPGRCPAARHREYEAVDVWRERRRRQDDVRCGGGDQDRGRPPTAAASCCCRPTRPTRSAMSSASGCRTRSGQSRTGLRTFSSARSTPAAASPSFASALPRQSTSSSIASSGAQASAARRAGTIGRCFRTCSTWPRQESTS